MAYSGTVVYAYHGTAGTAVDTVNFTSGRYPNSVAISNRGSTDLYFHTNLTRGTAAPVAGTVEEYIVVAGGFKTINSDNAITFVKVIATGDTAYSAAAVF